MTSDEQEVEAAVRRYYETNDKLLSGQGGSNMEELWLHDDRVTMALPTGDLLEGWDQVQVVWQTAATIGAKGRGGLTVVSVKVRVCGSMAYAASIIAAPPIFGGETLTATTVLEKHDGRWKVVHQHTDRSPKMLAALEKFTP